MVSDWNKVKLEEIAEITGGGTPSRSNEDYWNGNIPWLTPTDVTRNNKNHLSETENYITEVGLRYSSAKLIPENNVLMTSRATIGKSVINNIPMTTNQGFANFICDRSKVSPKFLLYMLNSKAKKFEQLGSGSTFKEISKGELKSFVVYLPPLKEQQKIAAILSSVDEAIEKTEQIIEQTELVKNGLMHRLLTKGIKHEEFKKVNILGYIPNGWDYKNLENVTFMITDGAHKSPETVENGLPIATVENMKDENIDINSCRLISQEDFNSLVKNSCKPNKYDVLLSKDGTIGKTLVYIQDEEIVLLSSIAIITPDRSILNPEFLKFFLQSNHFFKNLERFRSGSAIKRIVIRDIKKITIPIPPLDEQKKIADILREYDSKIANEKNKLNSLKNIKQGLMQQLLTGKVRVPIDNEEVVET